MDRSHKVDISGLLAGSRQLMVVEDEVPLEPFEGLSFLEPVRVRLELHQADRMLAVDGTVDARVTVRTPGPAVYSVRTVVLAPGETQEWHRLPGTEMAIVRTGAVTLEREGGCTPARFGEEQALFVSDGVPHRLANDGTAPAELVVTTLLAPGAPERE